MLFCVSMDIIPFINLEKRKITVPELYNSESYKDILEKYKEKTIYVMDIDGIEKNKPNLCLYQKLMIDHEIWVDSGPRNLGDVVDLLMAGSEKITIRKDKWEKFDIASIKEITENSVFIYIDNHSNAILNIDHNVINASDGIVIFGKKEDIEKDFKFESYIKDICIKKDVYSFESDVKNYNFWKNLGFKGLIVPMNLAEVFVKNEF